MTEEGIIYKDNTGATDKVLFVECRKNWVEHVNQGGFTDWQGNPAVFKKLTKVQRELLAELYRVGGVDTFDMT